VILCDSICHILYYVCDYIHHIEYCTVIFYVTHGITFFAFAVRVGGLKKLEKERHLSFHAPVRCLPGSRLDST
jgi:hypothetical protein